MKFIFYMQPHLRAQLRAVTAALALLPLSEPKATAITYRQVARTGQTAPGTEAGSSFTFFSAPAINNAGEVAFEAGLAGSSVVANNRGIWSEGGGSLHLVAREGSPAPGADAVFSGFADPVINNLGQTAFIAGLRGTVTDASVWSEGSGSLELVARQRSPAPGAGLGVMFDDFDLSYPSISDSGQVAFVAALNGPGFDDQNDFSGLWSGTSGGLSPVALDGSAAPGTEPGVNFQSVRNSLINSNGETAFLAYLEGPGLTGVYQQGIWTKRAGTLGLIARGGDAVPGMPAGAQFGFLSNPWINEAGDVAFEGKIGGVEGSTAAAIWVSDGESLRVIVQAGSPAPGTDPGVSFSTANMSILGFNDAGQTAFVARLVGPGVDATNDYGIWTETSEGLALIARTGAPAPGTGPGVVFSRFGSDEGAINNSGHVLFEGYVETPGADALDEQGLWLYGPNGLELVVRNGSQFEIAPGDVRTVSFAKILDGNENNSNRGSSLNDLGQVAFSVPFGVFVATPDVVPEPASNALVLACIGLLGATKRGRMQPRSL